MDQNLSHVTSFARIPRLLIAETNVGTVESLVQTLEDRRLDIDYEVCTSHDCAVMKLFHSPPPYQLVISSVHLATINNFFLLKHNYHRQPFVPFVITAGESDINSSRRALEEGAFDLIPTPLEHEQTVSTIRLSLWHHKLRVLITSRDNAIERYHQHLDNYPGNRNGEAFQKILRSIEESIASHKQTIERIEASIQCLADFDQAFGKMTRERALERLDKATRP